jgi:hypothetical protein
MKSTLPMRMQGMKQEVCQLFFAVYRQKKVLFSGKRTKVAAYYSFASTNESAFVDAYNL